MHAIPGWMCGVDFSCELGEANGGNTVYPSEENLRANRKCVNSGDEWCCPVEVVTMSKVDFLELVEKAGVDLRQLGQAIGVQRFGRKNRD